jgi:hypothetical protein
MIVLFSRGTYEFSRSPSEAVANVVSSALPPRSLVVPRAFVTLFFP